jgi:hypothetical protein
MRWVSIKTAPKDGKCFLASNLEGEKEGWAYYDEIIDKFLWDITDDPTPPEPPTHWVNLLQILD